MTGGLSGLRTRRPCLQRIKRKGETQTFPPPFLREDGLRGFHLSLLQASGASSPQRLRRDRNGLQVWMSVPAGSQSVPHLSQDQTLFPGVGQSSASLNRTLFWAGRPEVLSEFSAWGRKKYWTGATWILIPTLPLTADLTNLGNIFSPVGFSLLLHKIKLSPIKKYSAGTENQAGPDHEMLTQSCFNPVSRLESP